LGNSFTDPLLEQRTGTVDVGGHSDVDELEAVLAYDGVLDRVAVRQLAQHAKAAAHHRRAPHALAHRLFAAKQPLRDQAIADSNVGDWFHTSVRIPHIALYGTMYARSTAIAHHGGVQCALCSSFPSSTFDCMRKRQSCFLFMGKQSLE
jgi:hypothetical protein